MGLFAANPEPVQNRTFAAHDDRTRRRIGLGCLCQAKHDRRPQSSPLGGVATVFHSATPPIHSRSAQPTSRKIGACIMHAPLESSAATASGTSPEMPIAAATASNHGSWTTGATPQPPDLSIRNASQPFRCGIVPGTTRSTPTGRDCLAANTARAGAWSKPCPASTSTQAPLPELSISSTRLTTDGHRRPSRPLDSFLR